MMKKKKTIIIIVNRVVVLFCTAIVAFSSHSRASAELGEFVLGIGGSFDNNTTDSSEKECSVGESELRCLCGNNLAKARDRYIEELNQTCSTYNIVRDDSFLSFCEDTLLDLGYEVEMMAVTGEASSDVTFLNQSTLAKTVRSLEASLVMYKKILDRTLVGVYIETEYHRCNCFVSLMHFEYLDESCGQQKHEKCYSHKITLCLRFPLYLV